MTGRRRNHVLRACLDTVETGIREGAISVECGARLMLEHGAPSNVITRILTRVQHRPYPYLTT